MRSLPRLRASDPHGFHGKTTPFPTGSLSCVTKAAQAPILVWDFETGAILHKLELHKVLVQALAFSCEDDQGRIFLASIGGQDDCNLVIWNAIDGSPICGSPAANDLTYFVKFLNNDPYSLVTGGSYNLRVWSLHLQER